MKKKVSLKDIAKKAGVSIATVSYVLSKRENSGISPDVSDRINQIAKELEYRPNQIAKSLQSGKTFTIGLIVADISNPFFAHIARITEDEAKKNNYTVIFGSSDEKASKSEDLIQFLINRQVDGFIIAPAEGSKEQIKMLKRQKIPFVLIDRFFPGIKSNYVVINNYKAAFEATARLIQTGNKAIGIVAYSSKLFHMKERIRGYTVAMEQQGLSIKNSWKHEIDFSRIKQEVNVAIDSMLLSSQPVSAIFFATNTLAVNGLKRINELGIRIPEQLSIIVFDEGDAFDFFYCPLTYVKQPIAEMGKSAVKILIEQIANPERAIEQLCLDAQLVIRESCQKRTSKGIST